MKFRSLQLCAIAGCLAVCATAASHRNGPLLLEDQTANRNDSRRRPSRGSGRGRVADKSENLWLRLGWGAATTGRDYKLSGGSRGRRLRGVRPSSRRCSVHRSSGGRPNMRPHRAAGARRGAAATTTGAGTGTPNPTPTPKRTPANIVMPAISNIAINFVFILFSLLAGKKANCVPVSK